MRGLSAVTKIGDDSSLRKRTKLKRLPIEAGRKYEYVMVLAREAG